jgi:hypothetical protein
MGLGHGTSIVRDGLIFDYDMDNKRCWKGKPTTNLTTDTVSQNGWSGSYTLINSATKTFDVQITQPNAATTSAWRSHYWDVSSHIGSSVTISMDVEIKSITDCDFSRTAVGQGNTGSFPFHIAGSDAADKMQLESLPGKTHFTWTGVINATGIVGISTWITNVQANGANVVLRISNVQIEVNGFETPFVNGTRSVGDALSNIAQTADVTSINPDLTYNSDGTFEFDGVNDRILSNGYTYPNVWSDPFTLEAVIYIPTGADWHDTTAGSNSGTAIVGKGSYGGSIGLLRQDTQSFRFLTRTDAGLSGPYFNNAEFDTWYHLTGVHTPTKNDLYVNGELVASTTPNPTGVPDTGAWQIGGGVAFGGNTGKYGAGKIPIARVYNFALSEAEVEQNFNATRGRYGI